MNIFAVFPTYLYCIHNPVAIPLLHCEQRAHAYKKFGLWSRVSSVFF